MVIVYPIQGGIASRTTPFWTLPSGYHETKISTIVAEAGLTQAAFYLYFPSKEAIFAELIADLRARLRVLADAARLRPGLTANELPKRLQTVMAILCRE
ncbi:MAG TPA: helix-turn-helix domain-containing protein [Ktedonobacteraceae bacterium]|nr:helix-turn-helix domain-containing protein [Ktedonobacteraceae bacterium]